MYLSSKPGNVVLGLLAASLWLTWTTAAHAEMLDGRSLGMGGTRAANSAGTAFAPLYNPAGISGNGSMILPGATFGLGNNVMSFGQVGQLTSALTSGGDTLSKLGDVLKDVGNQTSRIEATVGVPIVGFNGHPFPLKLQGAPVDFGLNLYLNGGANVVLGGSQGAMGLFSNSGKILQDFTALQSAVTTGPQQLQTAVNQAQSAIQNLQNMNQNDPNSVTQALNTSATALESLNGMLNSVLSPVQSAATNVVTALSPFGSDTQHLGLTAAADGHVTLAVTGKATVVSTHLGNLPFDLSVGANLKGFIMPQVTTMPSLVGALTGDTSARDKVPPVATTIDLNSEKLASVPNITQTLSNANQIIGTAQTTFTNVLNTVKQARDAANAGNQQAAANLVPQAVQQAQQAAQSLPNITNMVGSLGGLQQNLTTDLKNIKVKATNFTEVSPVGVGADIGATAHIGEEFTVGASFDNVFVAWPGKQKTTNMVINTAGGSAFMVDPSAPTTESAANYDLTEPRALRLGGTYKPTKVPALTVAADVEQVFNGRPFAARVGGEYRLANVVGLRLGGQLGGLGNMVTGGVGVKAGAFNLDLGAGSDFARSAQGALNLSLTF